MRNWNSLPPFRERQTGCASRLPMRNWNFEFCLSKTRHWQASRLPMRNWNAVRIRRSFLPGRASRLPMRNWNSVAAVGVVLPSTSFQTTYEELKQSSIAEYQKCKQIASRLPMRNWNQEDAHSMPKIGRFQTTYEELKLCCSSWRCVAIELPDYLWGIETREAFESRGMRGLPDYLWGIETCFVCFFPCSVKHASRLPMRNWNR